MTGRFAFSANVHHPVVKSVFRLPASPREPRGLLSIQLGGPTGYSHVSLLVTDEEWRAIVRDVDVLVSRESITARLEYLRGEIRAQRVSYSEILELQSMAEHIEEGDVELREWASIPADAEKCPECGAWSTDADTLTEHVFAEHPEAVAR